MIQSQILTQLPIKIIGDKEVVNWKAVKDQKVDVIFKDKPFSFCIKGLDTQRGSHYILVALYKKNNEYDSSEFKSILCTHFKRGQWGNIVKDKYSYKYKIDENIIREKSQYVIIAQGRNKNGCKTYDIKCLKCNIIKYNITEKRLDKDCNCNNCLKIFSSNKFRLSDDQLYWIGTTLNNEEFLFDGDEQVVNYIMTETWYVKNGYIVNSKGERLHRVVTQVDDPDIFINHLGGNRLDNRVKYLTISDCVDNTRERKKSADKIVGLTKVKNNKFVPSIGIDNINIRLNAKPYFDALIDLLIIQKHYGFRHNIDLYYMLDNVSSEYVKQVIDVVEEKITKKTSEQFVIKNKNMFVVKNDTITEVYDSKGRKFVISTSDIDLVKMGNWTVINKGDNKYYVKGTISYNSKRKQVLLHRYLKELIENTYANFVIDHIDGDGLNNTNDNLVITTQQGNSTNVLGKNIYKDGNSYVGYITINRECTSKRFLSYEEARDWYLIKKQEAMNERIVFNNKSEVDKYNDQFIL